MSLITCNLSEALKEHLENYPSPKRVDVISSYIRQEGLEAVKPVFEKLPKETKIRVITTFQRQITDVESLDYLAKLPNASVYVFWPMQPTFHAKGWLFLYGEDKADWDTVIIGSSNITFHGIQNAIDWNVLLRRKTANPDANSVIDDFSKTFTKYIEEPQYRIALMPWREGHQDFEPLKAKIKKLLLTDEELIKEVERKHILDKKEIEAMRTPHTGFYNSLKDKVAERFRKDCFDEMKDAFIQSVTEIFEKLVLEKMKNDTQISDEKELEEHIVDLMQTNSEDIMNGCMQVAEDVERENFRMKWRQLFEELIGGMRACEDIWIQDADRLENEEEREQIERILEEGKRTGYTVAWKQLLEYAENEVGINGEEKQLLEQVENEEGMRKNWEKLLERAEIEHISSWTLEKAMKEELTDTVGMEDIKKLKQLKHEAGEIIHKLMRSLGVRKGELVKQVVIAEQHRLFFALTEAGYSTAASRRSAETGMSAVDASITAGAVTDLNKLKEGISAIFFSDGPETLEQESEKVAAAYYKD
jgi:HKD family nuclease